MHAPPPPLPRAPAAADPPRHGRGASSSMGDGPRAPPAPCPRRTAGAARGQPSPLTPRRLLRVAQPRWSRHRGRPPRRAPQWRRPAAPAPPPRPPAGTCSFPHTRTAGGLDRSRRRPRPCHCQGLPRTERAAGARPGPERKGGDATWAGGVAGGKVTEHRRLPWRKPAGSGAQRATPQRKRRACPFRAVDAGGGGRPAAARRGRQRPSPKSGGRQFGWDGTGKASRPTRGPCPAVATHCPPPSRRGQHARTTQEPSRSPTHPGGKRGGAGNRGLRSEAGGESAGGGGVAAPAAGKRTPLGLPHRAARGVSL